MFDTTQYAIHGARIITGRPEEVLEGYSLLIKDGRVERIAPPASSVPAGYAEYNLDGYTILPGLIDAHVHLAGCHTSPEEQELGGILENSHARAIRSVANAQSLLRFGFTSVRDISWNGLYLKRIIGEGSLTGPRIVACGPGLSRVGGHGDLPALPEAFVQQEHFWTILADGTEEVRRAVRRLLREKADQIKLWISGGDNYPVDRNGDTHYTMAEVSTAVEEACMVEGTLVCAHCENTESIRLAIQAGVDTIEHGEALDKQTAGMMAAAGTILVPTLGLLLNWRKDFAFQEDPRMVKKRTHAFYQRDICEEALSEEEEQERIITSFNHARAAEVPIALGSDTVFEPVTDYGFYSSRELSTLVQCGMTPMEALNAATEVSARALGLQEYIGTLEPGKIADFIVLNGHPDEDITILENPGNIHFIIQSGKTTVEKGKITL